MSAENEAASEIVPAVTGASEVPRDIAAMARRAESVARSSQAPS